MTSSDHQHTHYLPAFGHDRLFPLYDLAQSLLGVPRLHRVLVERAALRDGLRVLDIGCGTGNLLRAVGRRHPGVELAGIDPDPRAIDRSRRKSARAGLDVRLDQGFAEALPYPDGAFDRVLSSLMLHHVDPAARETALREARRVLVPGGMLVLMDLGGAATASDGFLARRAARAPRVRENAGEAIPDLLRAAGFVDVETTDRRRALFAPVGFHRGTAPGGG